MNVADVWRYYGGEVEMNDVPTPSNSFAIDIKFGDAPQIPQELWPETGDDQDTIDLLAGKRAQFQQLAKGPDLCKLDNCIRFTKFDMSANSVANVDPLSAHIMANDAYPSLTPYDGEVCPIGNHYDSFGCWTDNYSTSGMGKTTLDCCEWDSATSQWMSVDDPEDAPGFMEFYINGGEPMNHLFPDDYLETSGQWDSNHDGIGDQCSAWVDIEELEQEQSVLLDIHGSWGSSGDWVDYLNYCAATPCILPIAWTSEGPIDQSTGLPVRMPGSFGEPTPLGDAPETLDELENLCNICSNMEMSCSVNKYIVRGAQKMEFDVAGFSLDQDGLPSTTGACACKYKADEDCYGFSQKCWHATDEDWETDAAAYQQAAYDSEYDTANWRPRYTGYRRYGNRDSSWEAEQIAPACSRRSLPALGTEIPLFYASYVGDTTQVVWKQAWDENPAPVADGCQELRMKYQDGTHRELEWRYMGQVEPDPSSVAGFDWTTYPNGEQLWMEGNTTSMRVAIEKTEDLLNPGRKYWYKQWHTPVYDEDGDGNDRDRPFSEEELGGDEGAVVFVPTCSGGLSSVATIPIFEWEKVLWLVDPTPGWLSGNEQRFVTQVLPTEQGVVIGEAIVNRTSGNVVNENKQYELVGGGFPEERFFLYRAVNGYEPGG